jgi:hypothetical protein
MGVYVGSFGKLIPFLLVLVSIFGVYQLAAAVLFAARGNWPFAGLYVVMSLAGFALARSLWINKARLSGKAPPS